MNDRTRTRMLWTMAAAVIVYALVNVIVYFLSGRFGVGWFLASLLVYGAALVVAIMLLVADKDARPAETEAKATKADEPSANAAVTPASAEPAVSVTVKEPVPSGQTQPQTDPQ